MPPTSSNNLRGSLARSWFPIALVVLLLLAIPGFVLFGMKLTGSDGDLNRWFEENVGLSYHIPIGIWAAIILLLVPLLILLLYFLKLKRKPLSVPSTFLWKKSIEDLHVNSLFQWLRENILLLLQLLAVLFLIYALMDFRLHGSTTSGRHYIVLIDNSASMAATDVEPSRLEWAKREALKEIDAASENDYGMVIVFNSSADTLQSYTNNKGLLRRAVASIEQTQRPTRIDDALALADSLANPRRSGDDAAVRPAGEEPGKERTYVAAEGIPTEVHLYSDGRFPDVPEFSLGKLNLRFHAAGKRETEEVTPELLRHLKTASTPADAKFVEGPALINNLALAACNVNRDEDDPSKARVFVRVLNYRNEPVTVRLQLDLEVNGQVRSVHEQKVQLDARGLKVEKVGDPEEYRLHTVPSERSVTFELNDVDDTAHVAVRLRLVKVGDHFPLDDQAWLVISAVRKARILIVGKGNPVLQAFFDDPATRELAAVSYLVPADYKKDDELKKALQGEYDLVVFDRCGPEKEDEMPAANTFFVGHPPPPWKPDGVEKFNNPQIRGWDARHPLMRYLAALQEVGIDDAFRVKDLPSRTPRLLESDKDTVLLFTLSRQSFTDLVMTFPLITDKDEYNTNWWRLPSFPLFLRNLLLTLGNVNDETSEETIKPGQVKLLRPGAAVREVQVANPENKVQTVGRGTRSEFAFGETELIGVYRVGWNDNWETSFAVNLLDPDESNLEPRLAVSVGAEKVAAGEGRNQPRELWKWLLVVALGLLMFEWYFYNRRVAV